LYLRAGDATVTELLDLVEAQWPVGEGVRGQDEGDDLAPDDAGPTEPRRAERRSWLRRITERR
jgi:hypothetical protein